MKLDQFEKKIIQFSVLFLLFSFLFSFLSFAQTIGVDTSASIWNSTQISSPIEYIDDYQLLQSQVEIDNKAGESSFSKAKATEYKQLQVYSTVTDTEINDLYVSTSAHSYQSFQIRAKSDGIISFAFSSDGELYFDRSGNYIGGASVGYDLEISAPDGVSKQTFYSNSGDAGLSYGLTFPDPVGESFFGELVGTEIINDRIVYDTDDQISLSVHEGTIYSIYMDLYSTTYARKINGTTSSTMYVDAWNTSGFGSDGSLSFWDAVSGSASIESVSNPSLFYNPNTSSVPEPTTITLLGLGLIGFAGVIRRKS